MKDSWSIAMLISGALFAAGIIPITWERAPAWRTADPATFRAEFAYTLRRMDQLQPALLLACLAATIGFAVTAHGTARTLAALAAACLAAILAGSDRRPGSHPAPAAPARDRTCPPPTSNGSAPAGSAATSSGPSSRSPDSSCWSPPQSPKPGSCPSAAAHHTTTTRTASSSAR